jgi:hypothetical protein
VRAGGDIYLLKWILHDCEDEEAVAILRTTRASSGGHARLLVIEHDLAAPETTLNDVHMLVAHGAVNEPAIEGLSPGSG